MTVLGVDPGTASTGWGVVNAERGRYSAATYGVVQTIQGRPPAERLDTLYKAIRKLLMVHAPDVMAVEKLFFSTNARTAIPVAQARGVVLLAAQRAAVPVVEYPPQVVKMAVVGYGSAEKRQVQAMVKALLRLDQIPQPDDAADALAIAICHAQTTPLGKDLISSPHRGEGGVRGRIG